jgi:hypothetical protein
LWPLSTAWRAALLPINPAPVMSMFMEFLLDR